MIGLLIGGRHGSRVTIEPLGAKRARLVNGLGLLPGSCTVHSYIRSASVCRGTGWHVYARGETRERRR